VPVPRGYHHGDLRDTAIRVGLDAARTGGVGAVTVREVTRRVGVSPNSVYRHFADHRALVVAVALAAQDELAAAMRARIAALTANLSGPDAAVAQLRGVGLGYIDFAVSEPGWFELALLTFDPSAREAEPAVHVAEEVPVPFQLLLGALDACVEMGALSAQRREGAEWPCWSAVHGFADIATRGPLQGLEAGTLSLLGERVVDSIVAGVGVALPG
jgi:AcrR family transcriptional regulator